MTDDPSLATSDSDRETLLACATFFEALAFTRDVESGKIQATLDMLPEILEHLEAARAALPVLREHGRQRGLEVEAANTTEDTSPETPEPPPMILPAIPPGALPALGEFMLRNIDQLAELEHLEAARAALPVLREHGRQRGLEVEAANTTEDTSPETPEPPPMILPAIPPGALPALGEFMLRNIDQLAELVKTDPAEQSTPTESRVLEILKAVIGPYQEMFTVFVDVFEKRLECKDFDGELFEKMMRSHILGARQISSILAEAETLLFGRSMQGLFSYDDAMNILDNYVDLLACNHYRFIRMVAHLNGTTVEAINSAITGELSLYSIDLEKHLQDVETKGMFTVWAEVVCNSVQLAIPKGPGEQQKTSALIIPFNETSRG